MYIKPTQSLTQGCVGQHMFHSQNENHNKRIQKTDVCFRSLSAPAGKILAVATGVTAGPANLGRLPGGTRIFSSPIFRNGTPVFVINYTKKRH